ncbi:Peptidyl serine alpha-galactosyltransferase [Coccomyxa sp. Obi]|nr:Peptidyl serine alpha-galactosyltransferase [Coccomyxa sp. Obi]
MVTVVMTGCDAAAAWQSLGLYYSFLRSKQPGRFVRIAGCRLEDSQDNMLTELVPHWVTQGVWNYGGIEYPLYNKAWTIKQFMEVAKPEEDFILVLDSDMLIHRPFLLSDFQLARGRAASGNMWYLEDLNTLIVPELAPWLPSRFDWDAYPGLGRQADEVGEFYFMHREDMQRVAPLWWELTLPVLNLIGGDRLNPQAKKPFHKRIWYSEMHAYALGAAMEGIHHAASNTSMFQMDDYHPIGSPNGIHYAWDAKVPGHKWTFNKHNHKHFLAETCEVEFGQKGLFPHPPWPSELASKGGALIRDLLNIEVVATLNAAFCELHHIKHCSGHEKVQKECQKVAEMMEEIEETWRQLEREGDMFCMDMLPHGECADISRCGEKAVEYFLRQEYCRKSCGLC